MAINGDKIGDFGVISVLFRVQSSKKSPKMGKIGDFAASAAARREGRERGAGRGGAGTDEGGETGRERGAGTNEGADEGGAGIAMPIARGRG